MTSQVVFTCALVIGAAKLTRVRTAVIEFNNEELGKTSLLSGEMTVVDRVPAGESYRQAIGSFID